MPANTPRGFPYPLPAEPVAEGAQAIRNLAEAIDAKEAARELAYQEYTANVPVNVTSGGVVVVTAPAVTFDGATPIMLEFYSPVVSTSGAANQGVLLIIFADGVEWGIVAFVQSGAAANVIGVPVRAARRFTPPAGSRVYSIRARTLVAGTCNVNANTGAAGVYVPGFIRLTRV